MPTEKTVKTEGLSVYVKLAKARTDFLAHTMKKSGVNVHAEFEYWELRDIVPVANEILNKYKLLFLVTFKDGVAYGKLVNLEAPNDDLLVQFSIAHLPEPAKFRMNEIQAVGAEITYYRRYLYMLMFDLVESDPVEEAAKLPVKTETAEKKKPTPPPTPEERAEITETITAADDKADDLQVDSLKKVLKKLRELDPKQEEFVQKIAVKTDSFKDITKEQCEQLITLVTQMLDNYGGESE